MKNLIRFKRDTSFRKQFFVPDSFAHPAKMDAQLLIWIVEKFTKPGETILDPMAGSGTLMLACGLGRNVVLVELEEKFCKMMRDNWEEVRMRPQLGCEMGDCQIIQGDARNLEGLLVDGIISSPPYEQSLDRWAGDKRNKLMEDKGLHAMPKIDKCIFSPPYADTPVPLKDRVDKSATWIRQQTGQKHIEYGQSENQIGNLPYGDIDAVITSPPYEEAMGEKHHSPAYERISKDKHWDTTYTERGAEGNIGNLKGDTYLQAMAQVYAQCYKVLRPQGLMILVTKNFIRNQKEVRLDTDTISLCEQVGFKFQERWHRELPAQSFWRVIYRQKYPDAPELKYEDVLVFQKETIA